MDNTEKLEAAKACFDYNTNATECYVTSDLSCFLAKNHAANHAAKIGDRELDLYIKDENGDTVAKTPEVEQPQVESYKIDGQHFGNQAAIDAANKPAEETPVVEQTPAVEETPVVEETPAVQETPVVEETPAVEEAPAVEETPVVEETPAVEETPVAEAEDAIKHVVEEIVDQVEKLTGTGKKASK